MQEPMDLAELRARFDIVRRSEYFPAILGAVAGGLSGALMAGLIAGGKRGSADSGRERESTAGQPSLIFGLTARDLLQLVTVFASLARQMREWRK